MKASVFLSSEELEIISSAIEKAEKKTGGELILHVNSKSDSYTETSWKSGMFFFIIYFFIILLMHIYKVEFPFMNKYYAVPVGSVLTFFAGLVTPIIIPHYKRFIIGKEMMNYYTSLKAYEVFLHEEVFNTKQRTGILIYLSLFEKTAVILGDSGINSKVGLDEWSKIISVITEGITTGRKAGSIVTAIEMCGDLLEKAGVKKETADTDELSNEVRIG